MVDNENIHPFVSVTCLSVGVKSSVGIIKKVKL